MDFLLSAAAIFVSFFASLIPVLIWLAFWLFEDHKNPEPRKFLFLAFVAGMGAVFVVLPIQALAASFLPMGWLLITIWAGTEELMKFGAAYIAALRRSIADEPIDMPVYMITTALGFASVENAFFLFQPVLDGRILGTFLTGDLRFLGATLVHVLASSIIGTALAFAYYDERPRKITLGIIGVILAILLHAIFNSLIILQGAGNVLIVFMAAWVGVVFLLLAFERMKRVERPQWWQKIFMSRNA